MALGKMIYKSFKFPYNPKTTGFKCDRAYIKHKYPGLVGNELEDFGVNAISITGSGCFFGKNAYSNFNKLYKEFKKGGVGKVYHPIYKDITRGIMVNLEGTVEPEVNVINYTFEIIADTSPNTKESIKKYAVKSTSNSSSSSGSFNVGDIVYFKGGTHYVSSYKGSKGYKARAGKAKITIKNNNAHPYHLIHIDGKSNVYGWVDANTIQGLSSSSSSSSGNKKLVHTVKRGECLSTICAKYSKKYNTTISWRTIAQKNKISNPNKIYPGQKITIYY